MRFRRRRSGQTEPPPPEAMAPLWIRAFELGARDAEQAIPEPAAESVVPGRRQPPANFHRIADEAGVAIVKTKKRALGKLGDCAAEARTLPLQIAMQEGQLKRNRAELETRSDARFSRLAASAAPLAVVAFLVLTPFEVVVAESALQFTDLGTGAVRLVSVGAVVAFELALFVALFAHDIGTRRETTYSAEDVATRTAREAV